MRRARCESGAGLVELMVALVLSLFLLAGLFTIYFSTKQSYNDQYALSALQDNQVLAASVLADTMRAAGYFPYSSTVATRDAAFASNTSIFGTSATWSAGQVVYATGTTASTSHNTLTIRLVPSLALNCQGGSSNVVQQNTFSIDGNGDFECSIDGGHAEPLISPLSGLGTSTSGGGVQDMKVMIGVASGGGGSIDQYYAPNSLPAGDWTKARNVVVTLTFFNPLFDTVNTAVGTNRDSQGQPRYLQMTRVISLENLKQ
jgi:type IV pilus assembly protein PilW